jgi:MFS family permease
VSFARVYAAFAGAYLLSYVYRTVNAVISPELVRELALPSSSLGLMTSAYFLAFAAMQIPVGIMLDRYGPRRVEPVLLVIAAAGAAIFATSHSLAGLTIGRAVIGAGVCACLMAPLKAIAAYPAERQASYSGWIMVAGGTGALAATVPVELALRITSWRVVFGVLSLVTLVSAVVVFLRVPDTAKPAHAVGFKAQLSGVRGVVSHPRFWWIAPLGAIAMGSFMAIQGLWAAQWMIEVQGMSRAGVADYLLVMNAVIMAGYLAIGILGTRLALRGIHARHMFGTGFAVNFTGLALIVSGAAGSLLWWSLYGLGAAVNVLGFTTLNEGFPRALAGRTNTALNLAMFSGSFVMQWGIGLMVDAARASFALDVGGGLRAAFSIVLVAYALAFAWFIRGFRRYGNAAAAAAIA